MCLMIGAGGVGKTLLLKRLNSCSTRGNYTNVGDPPATIPTVGTNLMNVVTSRKNEVTVRELGGCMAPIWHNYYSDTNAVIFVVDLSNRQQISASCIQLMEVLTDDRLKTAPVLLIFNKVDAPGALSVAEMSAMCYLDDVRRETDRKLSVVTTSAREGQGLQEVVRWIQEHGKSS